MNPQMRVEIPYTYLPQTEFCHLIRMLKQKSVSTYYVMFSKQHKPRHSNKKYADTRVCQKKICRHTYIRYSINYSPSWGPQRHRNPFSHSLTHSRVPTSTTPLEASYQSLFFRLLAHFFQQQISPLVWFRQMASGMVLGLEYVAPKPTEFKQYLVRTGVFEPKRVKQN